MKIVHLADAPAMLFALCAAACSGPWAIPFALLAGATRETAPIFAALWSQSPWPLVGLLAIPWWRRGGRPTRNDHLFVHPWKTFTRSRWVHGISIPQYVLPFGGFVVGIMDLWSWVVGAVAAVPLFRAVDTSRLLLWAMPTFGLAAVSGATDGQLLAMIAWSVVTTSHWTP